MKLEKKNLAIFSLAVLLLIAIAWAVFFCIQFNKAKAVNSIKDPFVLSLTIADKAIVEELEEVVDRFEMALGGSDAVCLYKNASTKVSEMDDACVLGAVLRMRSNSYNIANFATDSKDTDNPHMLISTDKLSKYLLSLPYFDGKDSIHYQDLTGCPNYVYDASKNVMEMYSICSDIPFFDTYDYKFEKGENGEYYLYRSVAFKGIDTKMYYSDYNRTKVTEFDYIDSINYTVFSEYKFTFHGYTLYSVEQVQ